MSTTPDAALAYFAALREPDAGRLAALEPLLAEDAAVVGLVGAASGRHQVLEALAAPDATRMVRAAEWSEPVNEAGEVVVDANLPAGGAIAGMRFAVALGEDGRIVRVGQQMLPAAPPAPQPLAITPEMKDMIDGALANGTPFVVSYVDSEGVPHISPRGSVQALNERQIGIWARDPEAGLPRGIAANPNVALYYRDPKTRAALTIVGKAHIADEETRSVIYENQAAIERNIDGRKRGIGIVVDVEIIEAAGPAGRTKMVRGQA